MSIGARLSVMMFLQFFIWGAWYVTAPRFLGTLGFDEPDFGWMYSVGPIAGMISPFFVGMIADRFFATERVLGLMHLLGGSIMLFATTLMEPKDASPFLINLTFFGHMLCFFPTLALTNSLALQNMTDPEKQFPMIRVFGTIGWIVAGFILARLNWGSSINMFYLAGGAAMLLGIYSFTLPHTPPPSAGKEVSFRELLGLDAFVMLKQRSFMVFMVSSFLICIPLAFYYQMAERCVYQAGLIDPPFKMTFGQMSEIVFMVLMPFFFVRLGVKWMLLIGMAAWVVRYALFAAGAQDGIFWMMIAGILLHGICYDFFFVTGQIYTDKAAPRGIRSQAQGMLVLFTLGLGMLIGAQSAGFVGNLFTSEASKALQGEVKSLNQDVKEIEKELADRLRTGGKPLADEFAVKQQMFAQLTSIEHMAGITRPASERVENLDALLGGALSASMREVLEIQGRMDDVNRVAGEKFFQQLRGMNWTMIWLIPAAGAAVVMIIFGFLFRETPPIEVTEGEVAAAAATEEMM